MSIPIYILGGSQTDFARNWAREDLSLYDMFREALNQALTSTGISQIKLKLGMWAILWVICLPVRG